MENGGGFGNWIPNFASPYSPIPSPSSCSPFPDQLVVPPAGTTTSAAAGPGPGPGPGPHHSHDHYRHHSQHQAQAHHHLTCLKLGKRQYYAGDEPASSGGGSARTMGGGAMKRERSSSACAVVPRCQVEGCSKALIDAKDYHRRHKVCEMHSKAPKVVVLGTDQRFCQQCSRFHAISEFDDSKRSCRRRLAGHNERRRKSSSSGNDSIVRNPAAAALETPIMGSRLPFLSQTSPGRALSLLSSKAYPWIPTAELSSRSSAALRELIAENRAALLPRQLFSNRSWHSVGYENQSIISFGPHQDQAAAQGTTQLLDGWNQFQESGRGLTLDLMQSPNSTSFEFLPRTNKSKEEEEECCEIWKSLEGTHVV